MMRPTARTSPQSTSDTPHTAAIIGAGPIGLEVAATFCRHDIDYVQFDKGTIAQTIANYPEQMTFFSSPERIAIAGLPLHTPAQEKASKRQYLAYLRSVVQHYNLDVQTWTTVTQLQREGELWRIVTQPTLCEEPPTTHWAKHVVLAIGDMHRPRKLNIPGEDLPHVHHRFSDPHTYFGSKLMIIGGRNSAVEAALRCYHAGVDVALSYRGEQFNPDAVKYWLLPEMQGRIRRGEIEGHLHTQPHRITPKGIELIKRDTPEAPPYEVQADFILVQVGFEVDTTLYDQAGITLDAETRQPQLDPQTMMAHVPNIYIAGTATAGAQNTYTVFIETCHLHGKRIAHAIRDLPPPPESDDQFGFLQES